MSYAGSFNGFPFGTKARPGASVASLTGWRTNRTEPGADVRLGLNLHATTQEQLDNLIDEAMAAFVPSNTYLPLTIGGRSMWVKVVDATPTTDPAWPGPERTTSMAVQFKATDGVLYDATPTVAKSISVGSPVSSTSFEAANAGRLVLNAPRAYDHFWQASTNWVNPTIRVDHSDGSYERIRFQGLTVAAGWTLTVGADRVPRVGSQIVSGYVQSYTEAGGPSKGPRWWRLFPSDGTDGENVVSVGGTSGTFSGTCTVRGTY